MANAQKSPDDGPRHELIKILWRYSTPTDRLIQLCGALAAVGSGTVMPLMTIIFGNLVTQFNSRDSTEQATLQELINHNVLYFVYLFVARYATAYIYSLAFGIAANRITCNARLAYMRARLSQDQAFLDTQPQGSTASDLSQHATSIQNGLSETFGMALQACSTVTTALIIAYLRSWNLAIVVSTGVIVLFFGLYLTTRLEGRMESRVSKAQTKAAAIAEETLDSMQVIIAFGATSKRLQKYSECLDIAKSLSLRLSPIKGVQFTLSYFVLLSSYALAFWYGVRLLQQKSIGSSGDIVVVILCVNMSTNALRTLLPSWTMITKASVSAKVIMSTIGSKPSISPFAETGAKPELCHGEITLENVTFAYPTQPTIKVLKDVTINAATGKVTAIVGPSGSGKSTIISLLERWYDVPEGRILLDGQGIQELNVRWLRSQIGLVQQSPVLFNDTILQNVANGLHSDRRNLREDELNFQVQQACKSANIHEFICSLPQGYDTLVGEHGNQLSGGERQRIAIARAIISRPKILLLDEATSALDANSEKAVQRALEQVSKGRTTIVIAHKMSTIRAADKIIVLKQGEVVEEGTHNSLMEMGKLYHQFVQVQKLGLSQSPETPAPNSPVLGGNHQVNDEKLSHTDNVDLEAGTTSSVQKWKPIPLLSGMRSIIWELRRHGIFFAATCLTCILAGAVYPSQAIIFAKSISGLQYTGATLRQYQSFWALMWFILALAVCLAFGSMGTLFTITGAIVARHYRSVYFAAMINQDLSFHLREGISAGVLTADLSSHTQQLQDIVSTNLGYILVVVVNLTGSCILAILEAWKLALVAILGSLPFIVLASFLAVRLKITKQERNASIYSESTRFATEAANSIKTVSSLVMEAEVCDRLATKLHATVIRSYRENPVIMALFAFSQSASLLGMALAFWYGGSLLVEGEISSYQLFVIFLAVVSGGEAAGSFFAHTDSIANASKAVNSIFELRSRIPIISTSPSGSLPPATMGTTIEFRNVSFSYPSGSRSHPAIKGLSFSARNGQTVAIVGPSGSGKSTIITLLERMHDVTSGEILFRGQPLRHTDLSKYRSIASLVTQDTALYEGSIKDNVLLGVEEDSCTDERIEQACRQANIHDFIVSLPEGYGTSCGNRGLLLSGGQRQRIAIARALIRNPALLLLDEASSALDTESERQVQAALNNASRGRVTIAVAHRLSTIKDADQIIVLVKGEVREVGKHQQLIQAKGTYYAMCLVQGLVAE